MYCKEHLATAGAMTSLQPGAAVKADIEFGSQIVKQLAGLDIGQAIAVKEREVIAVEAIEGTEKMIQRAGQLCAAGGWTLIKVSKPNQDMRFDVPCVGPDTITGLAQPILYYKKTKAHSMCSHNCQEVMMRSYHSFRAV